MPHGEHRPLVVAGKGLLTFNIQNSLTSPDISYLFDAAGEGLIVHLAGILAAREYFGIKFPIIFDSFFEFLDRDLFIGVISALKITRWPVDYIGKPGVLRY